MKKIRFLLINSVLFATIASCNSRAEPFTEIRVKHWQELIAKNVPQGWTVEQTKTFFSGQDVPSRFDAKERILYAPQNIEPEPESLLPFGLIRSFDIRCNFTENLKLTECTAEASTKRW